MSAVNKLWSEQDFDALRPMMSERLWEALRHGPAADMAHVADADWSRRPVCMLKRMG
jgi:hypothetical protein